MISLNSEKRPLARSCYGAPIVLFVAFVCVVLARVALADVASDSPAESGDVTTSHLWRVLTLSDYNTRVVSLGAMLLGVASGLVGSFALLRRRALLGDAVSHATWPGIALAWMTGQAFGFQGKSLLILLAGAAVTGVAGSLLILLIRKTTRLGEDAALGIVLGVFFGAGIALFGIIQNMSGVGSAAGLKSFVYGSTASLSWTDNMVIAVSGAVLLVAIVLLFKELKLLCFDESFAGSEGYPVLLLDIALMTMIVLVTIIGLQAVGLILMIALLVIPPAAARFWTQNMQTMAWIAAVIGGASALMGAVASALWPSLPSGAVIVLVAACVFLFSMFFGSARGMVFRQLEAWKLDRRIDRQHLLRALYELCEQSFGRGAGADGSSSSPSHFMVPFPMQKVFDKRSWSMAELRRVVRRAQIEEEVIVKPDGEIRLTESGVSLAAQVVREHRLWEMYLITYAEVAPGRVDRGADAIEHVLDRAVISRLESLLGARLPTTGILASPHPLNVDAEGNRRGEAKNSGTEAQS